MSEHDKAAAPSPVSEVEAWIRDARDGDCHAPQQWHDKLRELARKLDHSENMAKAIWQVGIRDRQRAESAEAALREARKVVTLAAELCAAVDLAAEDIGGARPIDKILAELGPAVDAAERHLDSRTGKEHG